MAGRDLSRDDNTLFIARKGLLQTYKKVRSIYFVLVTFSITILVDVFSPLA